MELVLGAAAVAGVLVPLWLWFNGQLSRVRTAVLAAEPRLDSTIGSYSGASGSGLHANIHNSGEVRAYNLSLSFPTMGVVWQQPQLERGDWARPQMPIPDNAALRRTELVDPVASLTYEDRFRNRYVLEITLTQQQRDDGHFNLGSLTDGQVVRPTLTVRVLWRLRKQV